MSETKCDFVCDGCGGALMVDAWVEWDADKQDFIMCNVFTEQERWCTECDAFMDIKEVPVEVKPYIIYNGNGDENVEITDTDTIKALKKKVGITWCGEDVFTLAMQNGYGLLNADQINAILYDLEKYHDATIGINWDVIDYHISEHYNNGLETLKEDK
jgi:hypothetical protein